MNLLLLANGGERQFWHIVPMVIAISLVYGATRHEWIGPILVNAFKFGTWIVGFIGLIFAILMAVSRGL